MSDFDKTVKRLIDSKSDFSVTFSTNSKTIKVKGYKPIIESKSRIDFKTFHVAKRLKKELNGKLDLVLNDKPINYYFVKADYIEEYDEVYNIDFKSAYLNALKNNGLISDKIYAEIQSLAKIDRLISLGLLAYEPNVINYKGGEFFDIETVKNEYRPFFFFCVKEVAEIMFELSKICGEHFIFSWVDGIYFKKNDFIKEMIFEELEKRGYKASFDELKNFSCKKNENFFEFFYEKDGEKKQICVPTPFRTQKIKKTEALKNLYENKDFESLKKLCKLHE
jgi:hypothetical protein